MKTLVSQTGELAGVYSDFGLQPADTSAGKQLSGWLQAGVVGLRGVIIGDTLMDREELVTPDEPLFGLALLEFVEPMGWRVVDDLSGMAIANANPQGCNQWTGPGCAVAPKLKLPDPPEFVSSNKANVEGNKKVIAEIMELAHKGDHAAIAAHPGTPSPKLQDWKLKTAQAIHDHKKAVEAHEAAQLDMAKVKVLGPLGGSTGAMHVAIEGKPGTFAMKKGNSPEHVRAEHAADKVYEAVGAPTPKSVLHETPGGPIKFGTFLEGSQSLAEWKTGKTAAQVEAMHQQIGKHFVADALLGNWDVAGQYNDNIKIKDGTAYRIDNGGSFNFRAQGKAKEEHEWNSGHIGLEIANLRNPAKNENAAAIFKHLTPKDIETQAHELLTKREKILAEIPDAATKAIVGKRLDQLKELYPTPLDLPHEVLASLPKHLVAPSTAPAAAVAAVSQSATEAHTPHAVALSPIHAAENPLHTGEGWHQFLQSIPVKIPEKPMGRLLKMNTDGLKNGVIHIPAKKTRGWAVELVKHLPPGTVVKYASYAKVKAIDAKTLKSGAAQAAGFVPVVDTHADIGWAAPHMAKLIPPTMNAKTGKLELQLLPTEYPSKPKNDAWGKTLTPMEAAVVSEWKGSASRLRELTAKFLTGEKMTDYHKSEAKAVLTARAKAEKREGLFFRGLHSEYADAVAKMISEGAKVWSDPGVHGVSPNPHIGANNFSHGQVLLRIISRDARPVISSNGYSTWNHHQAEMEHWAQPGAKYRVVAHHKDVTVFSGGEKKQIQHVIDVVQESA